MVTPLAVGSLNMSAVIILNWIILCCESCSVHHRMFGNIFGPYLLDANSSIPPLPTKMSSDVAKCPEGGKVGQ